MDLNDAPRVRLGTFPTPLERARDLGALLGIEDLWVKRDDLTGYSWGGNKVRPIEFLLGDALAQNADTVVVCGGPTSNFAALMAAACVRHGLTVHHISYGLRPLRNPAALDASIQSGAALEFTGSSDRETMETGAQALAGRLRNEGKRPYVLPRGGATAVGALGYANAMLEWVEQIEPIGTKELTIVVPVGSGGTIAGLIAGWACLLAADHPAASHDLEIVGVSVSRPPEALLGPVETTAVGCLAKGHPGLPPARIRGCRWRLVDGRGAGFGSADARDFAMVDAISRATAFHADVTYNGKALRWLGKSTHELSGAIVYWHTGGTLGVIDRILDRNAGRGFPCPGGKQ